MAERKRKCTNCNQEHCKPWDEKCKRESANSVDPTKEVEDMTTPEEEVTREPVNTGNEPTSAITEILATVKSLNERFNSYDK